MPSEFKYLVGNPCAAPAPSEDGIYYPATITGIRIRPDGTQVLLVRFIGTSSGDYEFKPYDLIGEHLSNVASKQLSCGQNVYIDVNGRESIGIIRSANAAGYYDVAIEGRNVNVKRDEIRLLKNISPKSNVSIRNRTQSDISASSRRRLARTVAAPSGRSKDEFDVALTLASFHNTPYDFKNATRQEKDSMLSALSMSEKSVIQAPLTQRQMQRPDSSVDSMELDDTRRNDQGSDEEIDVVGNQDPLADIDHPLDDEDEIEHMETESDHIQPDNTPSVVVTPQTQPAAIFINSPGGFLARTAQTNQASSSVPINIQHATMQSLPGYATGSPLLHTGFQNLIIQPQNSPPVLLAVNQARQAYGGTGIQASHSYQPGVRVGNLYPQYIAAASSFERNIGGQYTTSASTSRHTPTSDSASPNTRPAPSHPSSAPVAPPGGGSNVRLQKKPGDGKKCRKIYGVNNKAEWCNACKWKKACVKFPD